MATLIAVYNSDGCVGRCDARCYDAKSKRCDCICGGKNHGVGLQRALHNNEETVEELIAENKARYDATAVVFGWPAPSLLGS